jgi:hypothetical protein
MVNSSKHAEAKIAGQSLARLNIDIKLQNRAVESLMARINNPRTRSREQIADGIREFEFTNAFVLTEPVSKSALAGVAGRGGERQ